jgi:hypothetical protein
MFVHQAARARVRAKNAAQRPLIVKVAFVARIDHQTVCSPVKQVTDKAAHTVLPSEFVLPQAASGVHRHLHGQLGNAVSDRPATDRFLLFEVELALPGEQHPLQGPAKPTDAGRINDCRCDQVQPAPAGFVNEGMDSHDTMMHAP